jgi:hypothetical protein
MLVMRGTEDEEEKNIPTTTDDKTDLPMEVEPKSTSMEGQKLTYVPNLMKLDLRVSSFENDYEEWYEFARFVAVKRRESNLEVTCRWEDGRIINLPDSDTFSSTSESSSPMQE